MQTESRGIETVTKATRGSRPPHSSLKVTCNTQTGRREINSQTSTGLQTLKQIVCPVDNPTKRRYALRKALELAELNHATLHVVHVYRLPFWFIADLRQHLQDELRRSIQRVFFLGTFLGTCFRKINRIISIAYKPDRGTVILIDGFALAFVIACDRSTI
ncbi:MAG: universal stress protein [Myxococcales bacterium]|nr:MAG: universal stress protein [Myxococcales bacterium]